MNEVLNTMTNADPTLKWRFDGAIKRPCWKAWAARTST